MTMWKVTVAPVENLHAWATFVQQQVIAIGWPNREDDANGNVRRFRSIEVGDWVVAHVPPSHGGRETLAKAVGKVIGEYIEIERSALPEDDGWAGNFRRQFHVSWTIGDHLLRGILNPGQYRNTVMKLSPQQEHQILDLYGIA